MYKVFSFIVVGVARKIFLDNRIYEYAAKYDHNTTNKRFQCRELLLHSLLDLMCSLATVNSTIPSLTESVIIELYFYKIQ